MKITYTYHGIERRLVRRVSKAMVAQTIQKPDQRKRESDGDTQFIRTLNKREVHVVAKPLDKPSGWLVKTVWVDGEDDPNFIVKFLITIAARVLSPILK